MEPFSKSAWRVNVKTLTPRSGNYRESWNQISSRGGGNPLKGLRKSFSMADPGVASDLKSIKLGASGLGKFDPSSINKIASSYTYVDHRFWYYDGWT